MNAVPLRRQAAALCRLGWPLALGYGVASFFWFRFGWEHWTGRFGPLDLQVRLEDIAIGIGLPITAAWHFVGLFHSRLILNAEPFRIPGFAREHHGSLGVLAAATLAGTSLLGAGLAGFAAPTLAVSCAAILLGLAGALFPTIGLIGAVLPLSLLIWTTYVSIAAWFLAAFAALLWFLRLRSLLGAARAGVPTASLRYLTSHAVTSDEFREEIATSLRLKRFLWAGRADRHQEDRSPDRALRLMLGPSYGDAAFLWSSGLLLVWAAGPWLLWLSFRHDLDIRLSVDWLTRVRGLTFDWAYLAFMMTGAALMAPVHRLADLFRSSGGDFSELALLPGLGGDPGIRAALVRQTLLRPILWLGLGFVLAFGSSIAAQALLGARFIGGYAPLMLLALPMAAVLSAGAVTAVAVPLGLFDRTGVWLVNLPIGVTTALGFASSVIRPWIAGRVSDGAAPPAWLWGAWGLILIGLLASLQVLLARWFRRRHFLCRF